MRQFNRKNILEILGGNISKLIVFQVIEKIFPLLSLWLVSILYDINILDNFGFAIISVSTVIAWSTSGIGVATTKTAVGKKHKEMDSLYSLSGLFSVLTILVFIVINVISNNFSLHQHIVIIFSGYLASISVLKKSYYIALYKWRVLYIAFTVSLVGSLLTIIFLSLFEINFPELGIFVFYFLLSLLLKANFYPKLKYNKSVVEYFMNELGPLYFTGIISGSVVFVLTLIADSQEDKTGITTLIAIGFQIITILQFIPMALNRVLFITIASGEKIKSKLAIMRLLVFTILVAIPFYITIPFLGSNYAKLSSFTFVLLVLCSIGSTYSTFFGNILVAKGKTKQWTLITFIGTIIGISVIFFPFHIKLVDLVFMTATFIYFIQFILGIIYNEKYRILHI